MNRVIITGATSMIGIALIEECIRNKVYVLAICRKNSNRVQKIPKSDYVKVFKCDLKNLDVCIDKNYNYDVFYHFAWMASGSERNIYIDQQCENIGYTIDAIHIAKKMGCTKFVGAGSQAEFGKIDIDKIAPGFPCNPTQPYGIAKYAAGKLAMAEGERLDIITIWTRIFSVYGKNDRSDSMISSTINKMRNGEKLSFTEGTQRWDYLYEKDVGRAFFLLGQRANTSKIYCLGSGQARLLRSYIEDIRDIVNPEMQLTFGEIPYTEETVMNMCADISELEKDIGWVPNTSFRDGISEIAVNN